MVTNDYLSAAELAEIEARDKAYGDGETEQASDIADDRGKLLRHLGASDALITTLRELLGEREWDFEDNGRESNSCRTCGVTLRHGDPMKHAPGCALDAALRGDL